MNQTRLLAALFVLCASIGFTSCSSDSDVQPAAPVNANPQNPADPETSLTGFNAIVGGQSYHADEANAAVAGNVLVIAGMKVSEDKAVTIIVPQVATGTYVNAFMYYAAESNRNYAYYNRDHETGDLNGTVTITEIDTENNTVTGSFSFTADRGDTPVEITNGTFEGIAIVDEVPRPSPIDQGFAVATVNGEVIDFPIVETITSSSGLYSPIIRNNHYGYHIQIGSYGIMPPGTYGLSHEISGNSLYAHFSAGNYNSPSDNGAFTVQHVNTEYMKGTFSFQTSESEQGPHWYITEGSYNLVFNP